MVTLSRIIIFGLAVLTLGTALCLLDGDHGTGGGLCGSVLLAVTGVLSVSYLRLVGRFVPLLATVYQLVPVDLPVPPPKR